MASRGLLTLPDGELRDIETAAQAASEAVAHLRQPQTSSPVYGCGHRCSTACTDDRCTVPAHFTSVDRTPVRKAA